MNHRTILVVDDEPKLVRLVSEILHVARYQVITSSSGEKAIEAAIDKQPDLILLDIVLLGGMDGFEAATRIRQFSQVPIIMLTAKIKEADKLQGLSLIHI
jgi:DNA-binding response OmpR family regulator